MTSVATPFSRNRSASSTAISSNGFMLILTFARSTPVPSDLTRGLVIIDHPFYGDKDLHGILPSPIERARRISPNPENFCPMLDVYVNVKRALTAYWRHTSAHVLLEIMIVPLLQD